MLCDILPIEIYNKLCKNVRFEELYEIRLLRNKYIQVVGKIGKKTIGEIAVDSALIQCILERATHSSIYAYNHQIKKGFIACDDGMRIGLVGEAVIENDSVKTIKNITGLVIRIPHEIKGCADKIIGKIKDKNVLIISPPACGKTTILRDIARQISSDQNVLIIDEKNEISASRDGQAMLDVGSSLVMLNYPRDLGFETIIRNTAPDVIITDEIYSDDDIKHLTNAIKSGVKIITSIHSDDIQFDRLLYPKLNFFGLYVFLSKDPVGSIKTVRSSGHE